jgi:putative transposase
MKRKYRKRSLVRKRRRSRTQERLEAGKSVDRVIQVASVQLPLGTEALEAMLRDDLHRFATEMGLRIAQALLDDEVRQLCGERHERGDRRHYRYGSQAGFVTLGGQKLTIQKPRVRFKGPGGEAELQRYRLLQQPDAMPHAALNKMLRGVSTRNYEEVIDTACEGFGVKRSSVSRSFVAATKVAVEELAQRRFTERFVVIYIDGVHFAGEVMIVAMGVTESGQKQILGLRQGATENAAVCIDLLEDLRDRGLDTSRRTLFVLDGSKALRAAVRRVCGDQAIVQRCQLHKRRNIENYLPQKHHAELRRLLAIAWQETSYDRGLKQLKTVARWLDRLCPDAAASLREGMEELLTVVKLQVPAKLRTALATTNPVESALSMVRRATCRVTTWQDGDMRQRWCTAAILRAETRFNKLRGHTHLADLRFKLDHLKERTLDALQHTA